MPTFAAYALAALCAGLMGYAIQRGATCTVAAMDELVRKRQLYRLRSMLEASLWVLGGLLIAQVLHLLPQMPAGYELSWATLAGGVLLGLGAYVNKACVFGAIARLGSGEWAYAVTPIGFYVGCVTVGRFFSLSTPARLADESPVLHQSGWLALAFAAAMTWRIAVPLLRAPAIRGDEPRLKRFAQGLAARVWSPHAATTVIGVTFVVMLLAVGAWAYTDVLAELARGMAATLVARSLLLAALLAGAVLGGYTAGRFRHTRVTLQQTARCFAGGVMMGWGSLLIPGGNDGLILVGIPLLWPYAWIAFLVMCVSIALALVVEKSLAGHGAEQAVH